MEDLLILAILAVISGPVIALIAAAKVSDIEKQIPALRRRLEELETRLAFATGPAITEPAAQETPSPPPITSTSVPKPETSERSRIDWKALHRRLGQLETRSATCTEPAPLETPPSLPKSNPDTLPSISWAEPAPAAPKPTPGPELREATPEPEQPRIDWKEWLRRFHLCPLEKETSGEVGLAAWWATRIGILLGVIAVVFLGVHVNRMTTPWMRFVELLAISVSVFSAGWWLEKRLGRFGDIVSSGGLAMLYFTAYASHAVTAVQITDQAWLGGILQILALGVMLGWSHFKRDAQPASAAIGLGYVSCTFAAGHGLPWMTLAGLTLLGAISSVLLAKCHWRLPFLVSVIGS
ncbi:MAG: hypothetical protein ACKVHP_00540, partial [Verrucomicrobiales bacterium]